MCDVILSRKVVTLTLFTVRGLQRELCWSSGGGCYSILVRLKWRKRKIMTSISLNVTVAVLINFWVNKWVVDLFYSFPIIHTNKLNARVKTVTCLKGGMRDGGKQLKRLDGGQTKWLSGESRWLVKDTEVGRNSSCTRKQPNQTRSRGLE